MSRSALKVGLCGALVALAAAPTLRRAGAALVLKTTGTVVRDERPLARAAQAGTDGR
ncbi:MULTISPECIES: hypothetical protein [unclassified Streptomyces]|uniref:hypothetical protein n=1 Tax=unclassified Streptomyces TaxID=2593676 RepID=UPI00278BF06C|nr:MULTISPECIES: hypothetical protein [unclassified Streptomyces]